METVSLVLNILGNISLDDLSFFETGVLLLLIIIASGVL